MKPAMQRSVQNAVSLDIRNSLQMQLFHMMLGPEAPERSA